MIVFFFFLMNLPESSCDYANAEQNYFKNRDDLQKILGKEPRLWDEPDRSTLKKFENLLVLYDTIYYKKDSSLCRLDEKMSKLLRVAQSRYLSWEKSSD